MRRFAPAMREIVVDTETIGRDPLDGHRIFEIGAVDLINRSPGCPIFRSRTGGDPGIVACARGRLAQVKDVHWICGGPVAKWSRWWAVARLRVWRFYEVNAELGRMARATCRRRRFGVATSP
jgi:hypothetical protein